jgi:hypothetical protein
MFLEILMRIAEALSIIAFLTCSAASADEAIDRACASAAASRVPSVPGAPIKALRILDMPNIFRVPHDEMSRMLEVEIGSESTKTTYLYICKIEPSHATVLDLVNIQ